MKLRNPSWFAATYAVIAGIAIASAMYWRSSALEARDQCLASLDTIQKAEKKADEVFNYWIAEQQKWSDRFCKLERAEDAKEFRRRERTLARRLRTIAEAPPLTNPGLQSSVRPIDLDRGEPLALRVDGLDHWLEEMDRRVVAGSKVAGVSLVVQDHKTGHRYVIRRLQ